jgi:hypothetical protein
MMLLKKLKKANDQTSLKKINADNNLNMMRVFIIYAYI